METSTLLWLLSCVLTGLTMWLALWSSEKKSYFYQVLPVVVGLITFVVIGEAYEAGKKERLAHYEVAYTQRGEMMQNYQLIEEVK